MIRILKKCSSFDKFHEISFSSIVPECIESLILELSNEFETKSMYYHTDFHFIKTFIKEFVNGFENLKIDRKLRNIAYVSFFEYFFSRIFWRLLTQQSQRSSFPKEANCAFCNIWIRMLDGNLTFGLNYKMKFCNTKLYQTFESWNLNQLKMKLSASLFAFAAAKSSQQTCTDCQVIFWLWSL